MSLLEDVQVRTLLSPGALSAEHLQSSLLRWEGHLGRPEVGPARSLAICFEAHPVLDEWVIKTCFKLKKKNR